MKNGYRNREPLPPTPGGAASAVASPSRYRLALVLILALSVLLRLAVALYLGDAIEEVRGGTYDQVSYDVLAQRVADGYGFTFPRDWWPYVRAGQPTTFWSYLYTLLLAGLYRLAGHHPLLPRIVQALAAGLLTPWLLYRLGRRAFGQRAGLIAAAIGGLYLYFAHYAASLMTESLYIVGILWTVDVAMRLAAELGGSPSPGDAARRSLRFRLGLELGLAMAMTLLLRQLIVAFWAVLVLWLLWVTWRSRTTRRLWPPLLVAGLVAMFFISPWLVRNYRLFHRLTLPNTNAGFAFFWANHPIYGTRFEAVLAPSHGLSYQDLIPSELRGLDEAALDRALLSRGLAFVVQDPARYLLLSLSRIPVFFLFWPTADSTLLSNAARLLSFGLFLPLMLLGLCLAVMRMPAWYAAGRDPCALPTQTSIPAASPPLRFEFVLLFLLFIVPYTAIHLASWANVRYRLPVDAFLILFAAYAIDRLWGALRSVRRGRSAHA